MGGVGGRWAVGGGRQGRAVRAWGLGGSAAHSGSAERPPTTTRTTRWSPLGTGRGRAFVVVRGISQPSHASAAPMLYRQNDPLPVYPLRLSYARLGQYMKRLERRSICSTWVREKKRD